MKIYDTATAAIMRQTQKMEQSAKNVAQAGDINGKGKDVDLAREAVNQIEATQLTKANINVIRAEDERTKSLLDIFA